MSENCRVVLSSDNLHRGFVGNCRMLCVNLSDEKMARQVSDTFGTPLTTFSHVDMNTVPCDYESRPVYARLLIILCMFFSLLKKTSSILWDTLFRAYDQD